MTAGAVASAAGFCKTSGGLGLHVYVLLAQGHGFEHSKAFARSLAARLASDRPHTVTDRRQSSSRTGRVLIRLDPNSPRALTVAPYSPRADDLPSVSTPVGWDEVDATASGPGGKDMRFDSSDVLDRACEGRPPPCGARAAQRLPARQISRNPNR